MAIILDHTSSGNITLKGPPNALPQDNFTFTFPNVTGVSYVLTSGTAISSISGLQSALDTKVNICDLGTAAYLNYGTQVGDAIVVGFDGKIANELLPQIAITDTFLIDNTGLLTGLIAEKGDIGIITGANPANYILVSGSAEYINNWSALAAPLGGVTSVNNITPTNGNVEILASGITYANSINPSNSDAHFVGQNLKTVICYLNESITGITGNYLTCTQATGILENYVQTGYATGVFNSKANLVHTHPISGIVNLSGCLDSLKTFIHGSGGYSIVQYNPNALSSQASGLFSAALGEGAQTIQNYEIAHAAGYFLRTGDAQTSKLLFKGVTENNTLTTLGTVCVEANSILNFNAYIIGKTSNKYTAFRIEGLAKKDATNESLQLINDYVLHEFVNTDSIFSVDVTPTVGNLSFKVQGVSDEETKWLADVNLVKISFS
jgi:hypothetical protein